MRVWIKRELLILLFLIVLILMKELVIDNINPCILEQQKVLMEETETESIRIEETKLSEPTTEMKEKRKLPEGRTYIAGAVGFWERELPDEREKMILKEELSNALLSGSVREYLSLHESDYVKLREEEIEYYANKDESGILQAYYYDIVLADKENTEWFYFKRNGDIVIRRPFKSDNTYFYDKFRKLADGKSYSVGLSAKGENQEFFFVEWNEEDYIVVTRNNTDTQEIEGITVYCVFSNDEKLGWAMCLLKDDGGVTEKFYTYTTMDGYMRWPEY